MPEHDDLLRRFQPVLRYDSNEQFFADSAEQYMVNPGCELRRARTKTGNGAVLASATPSGDAARLELAFLGPESYADGSTVEKGDVLSVKGKDYREQYRSLRVAHPELNNIVYGHAVEANGRVWLQYWLWYFYNDYQLSFALGTHEGDWEMVQFRMDDAAGHPDIAIYAQHRYGEMRPWEEVEKFPDDDDRAIVYVARGSHASYFEAGFHQTEAWYDLADGKRRMKHKPALRILGDDDPAWVRWPGRWGDTVAASDGLAKAVTSNSPDGPGVKKQWLEPDKMLDNPPAVSKHGKAPAAPDVRVVRSGGRLRVEYDVTQARAAPDDARRDRQLGGRAGRATADAQRPRALERSRQGHDGRRARPAEALRRVDERGRRRSADPVRVRGDRDRGVRQAEDVGAAEGAGVSERRDRARAWRSSRSRPAPLTGPARRRRLVRRCAAHPARRPAVAVSVPRAARPRRRRARSSPRGGR